MSAIALVKQPQQTVGFKRVLIATDFSGASERALAHALPIARRYGSLVSIVHAIPPEPRESITWEPLPRELDRERLQVEKEMGWLAEESFVKDLHPHMLLEKGRVWDVLSSIMQREDTDLLVLGTHGRGGLKKLALGSVAEEVLRLAACPVLTVGPNVPPADPGRTEFKTILFTTDSGPASDRAFAYALSLAEDCHAHLVLLHMVPPMPAPDIGPGVYGPGIYLARELTEWQATMKKESMRRLKELVPSSTKLRNQPEFVVGLDFLPEGILDTAAAHNADLIVMGATRVASARAASHAPWALTHDVICGAQCPVLTVLSEGRKRASKEGGSQ
jgi:nucleotide-binding universal stress UspA family protein